MPDLSEGIMFYSLQHQLVLGTVGHLHAFAKEKREGIFTAAFCLIFRMFKVFIEPNVKVITVLRSM